MVDVQYSVLCHYPSIVAKDCISLGILLYNKSDKSCVFETTKKWDIVKGFNDELDIDLVKIQLKAIYTEFNKIEKNDDFDLFEYTRFYVNELKFTEVVNVNVEDFQEFVSECHRQYLRMDINKKDRPTVEQQINFVKKIMKTSKIPYKIDSVKGYFDESINFDFTIEQYAFKLFRFEGRQENRLIKMVKDWAYNAYKLKDQYNFIFVTDIDFESSDNYQTLYRILKEESAEIISFNDTMSFIQKINDKQINNF